LDLLRGFGSFLLKELRELIRDPKILLGMIIVPLIMFPVLGAVMNFSVESAKETAGKTAILVLNHDTGDNSTQFIAYLNGSLRVEETNASTANDAVQQMAMYNASEMIEIPYNFSHNMSMNMAVQVKFYSIFSGGGIFEGLGSSIVDSLVEQFNRNVAPDLIVPEPSVIIKGKIAENIDPRMLSNLMISQAIALPITILILLTYSMQIAATSVAMEKEEKTLETVLTLPVDRFSILMGKLSGSIIVAGVGALAYMVGFNYYMGSLTGLGQAGAGPDLASLGLVPSLFGYVLLGISLFITLLSALALAVILSAFAEDVRSAQSLVSYVYPLIFIPSLVLMYVDINTLPVWLKLVLYAIPFSQPIIASKAVIMGDYLTAGLGIVYVVAFTLVIMYIASRLFATERILTAKLKLKGLRRRQKASAEV
jgi:ABC-2 type transport system permease protein